jgi:hypothetical protein
MESKSVLALLAASSAVEKEFGPVALVVARCFSQALAQRSVRVKEVYVRRRFILFLWR